MAHETVYGICENKCRHEVYRKDDANETFLKKTDASNLYAIKDHATSRTTYGIGTPTLYGHLQLTNDLSVPEQATAGRALAASAGKVLNDKINALESRMEVLENTVIFLSQQINDLRQRVQALEDAQ